MKKHTWYAQGCAYANKISGLPSYRAHQQCWFVKQNGLTTTAKLYFYV